MQSNILIAAGMRRGGSTLQFLLIKDVLDACGIAHNSEWVNRLSESHLASARQRSVTVFKTHMPVDCSREVLDKHCAKVFYSSRDPRDCLVSYLRKYSIEFSRSTATHFLDTLDRESSYWLGIGPCAWMRYESALADLEKEVRAISEALGVVLSDDQRREIVGRRSIDNQRKLINSIDWDVNGTVAEGERFDAKTGLHPNHIHDGAIEGWRQELTKEQLVMIESRYGEMFSRLGYRRSTAQETTAAFLSIVGTKASRLWRHIRNGTLSRRTLDSMQELLRKLDEPVEKKRARRKKVAWQKLKASGGSVVERVSSTALLRLRSDNKLAEEIFLRNFEAAERLFVQRYLRRADCFVDVGANIGLFTVIAAKCVGRRGRVVAFEPAAGPRRGLMENIELNNLRNVSIEPLALSDSTSTLMMSVPQDGYDAWGSLGAPIEGGDIKEESVRACTWDEYSQRMLPDCAVTMIKIDVEGWESRVIAGAEAELSRPDAPLLQVEFTDAAAAAAGSSCKAVYEKLISFGYSVCHYDPNANILVAESLRVSYPYMNLYATKDIVKDNLRLAKNRVDGQSVNQRLTTLLGKN